MKAKRNTKTREAENRLYHAAKVSEYQFKRVLWSFVREEPVAEAARHITLSANSINTIYAKLRAFFCDLGVFSDIYEGGDPRDGTKYGEDFLEFEFRLLGFHLSRAKRKRRMKDTTLEQRDENWCESHWRFHYTVLTEGRHSGAIDRMMFSHLLAHIRLCGPIGKPPTALDKSRALLDEQFAQRLLWLERNAPAFRDEASRIALRELRESE